MVHQQTIEIRTTGHRDMHDITVKVALVVGTTLLMLTGCESSGQYEGDNVNLQFGNTNDAVQVQVQ